MLVCGDFIGGGNYGSNSNYHTNGFPSVGSPDYRRPNDIYNNGYPSVPLADPNRPNTNYHTNGFPSVGSPDYRRPNSDIYTHGFPSVGGNTNNRGNSNTGYPNGNTNYPRDPNPSVNTGGGFGGSSYNYPSPNPSPSGPSNYNPIGQRFGDTNSQTGYPQYGGPQTRPIAGFPNFNSITVGLSRFGLFNSNRPNTANGPYGPYGPGNSYPNRNSNINGTGSSVLDVARFEGNGRNIFKKLPLQKSVLS